MVNINNIWQKDPFVLRGAGGESVPKLQSSLLSIFLVQIFHKFRTLVIGWMVLLAARFAGGAQIVLSTWVFFKFRRHVRWNWVIIRIIIWQIFTTYQSVNWQRCPDIRDCWWCLVGDGDSPLVVVCQLAQVFPLPPVSVSSHFCPPTFLRSILL